MGRAWISLSCSTVWKGACCSRRVPKGGQADAPQLGPGLPRIAGHLPGMGTDAGFHVIPALALPFA
jgi:hypothetical protein